MPNKRMFRLGPDNTSRLVSGSAAMMSATTPARRGARG
jgi:hypothetical protein